MHDNPSPLTVFNAGVAAIRVYQGTHLRDMMRKARKDEPVGLCALGVYYDQLVYLGYGEWIEIESPYRPHLHVWTYSPFEDDPTTDILNAIGEWTLGNFSYYGTLATAIWKLNDNELLSCAQIATWLESPTIQSAVRTVIDINPSGVSRG